MEVPYIIVKNNDDIVYSPNKYRETEGIKEIKRYYSSTNAKILV